MKRLINRTLIPFFALLLFYFFVGKNPAQIVTPLQISPTPQQNAQVLSESDSTFYPVTKVVDGDTFHVVINGKNETIRLIGIDTPEVVDPRKTVQCFGREASNKAKELLTGKKVRLEFDSTQGDFDKYQRRLAYAFLEDGTFYNKYMIAEGFAHEYTYDLPYKYQKEFKQAQQQAEQNKKGFWADNACT
jgi:micrococcal nuclease